MPRRSHKNKKYSAELKIKAVNAFTAFFRTFSVSPNVTAPSFDYQPTISALNPFALKVLSHLELTL